MVVNENRMIQELPQKDVLDITDIVVLEDEDGTKTASIESLKNAILGTTFFNNIADLKNAQVAEGDICITLGYRTVGDGGGATYSIVNEPATPADGAFIHYLNNYDALRAKMVVEYGVTPESCGAYGDGYIDDSEAFNAIVSKGYKLVCNIAKQYVIEDPIKLNSNIHLDFGSSTIIPKYCAAFEMIVDESGDIGTIEDYTLDNILIENFNLDLTDATGGIISNYVLNNTIFREFNIYNNKTYAMRITSGDNITLENFNISGIATSTFNVGISMELQKATGLLYNKCNINIKNGSIKECFPGIMGSNIDGANINIENVDYLSELEADGASVVYGLTRMECPEIPEGMEEYDGYEERYLTNTKDSEFRVYITSFYKHNIDDNFMRMSHVIWLWSKLSLEGVIGEMNVSVDNGYSHILSPLPIKTTSNIAYDSANKEVLDVIELYTIDKHVMSERISIKLLDVFSEDRSLSLDSTVHITSVMSGGLTENSIPQSALFKTSTPVLNNVDISNCNVVAQACIFSTYDTIMSISNMKSNCWAILDIRNADSKIVLNGYISNSRAGGVIVSNMYADVYNNANIISDSNDSTLTYANYSGSINDSNNHINKKSFTDVVDDTYSMSNIFNVDLTYIGTTDVIINNIEGGMDNQIITIISPDTHSVTINNMATGGNIHLAPLPTVDEPVPVIGYILKYGSMITLRKSNTQWYQVL